MIFYNEKYGLVEIVVYGLGEEILTAFNEENELCISVDYFKDTYEFIGFI